MDTTRTNLRHLRIGLYVSFGIIVTGAFLPWAELGIFSKDGIEGDGLLTLVLAGSGLALAMFSRRPRGMLIAASAALLCLLIALVDYVDISSSDLGSVGSGLYLTLVASIFATIITGILAFSSFRKPSFPEAQPEASPGEEGLGPS